MHFETYRETLLELVPSFNNGRPITRHEYDTRMSGLRNPELVASILPHLPLAERTRIWQTKEARYEDVISQGVPPIPGLIALLHRLEQHTVHRLVVTNSPKGSFQKTMKSIGIAPLFDARAVIVAEECDHPKPHPAPYLRALQQAGVASHEAIVFEDSPSGTTAATAAGILTVGIRSTQSDETLRAAGAAFTIADYTDPVLEEALQQWLPQ